MRSGLIFAAVAALAAAAPVAEKRTSDYSPDGSYFPLQDGFPTPNDAQKQDIENRAFGPLGNAPPPKPGQVSDQGLINLRLIALNELFEVSFFTELIYNLTNRANEYNLHQGHSYILDTLKAIQAQEELHLLNANGALSALGQEPIQGCKYNFPVTDFQGAIALAGTFTDLVMGTLQDVSEIFAENGDHGLVRGVASVIAQEAEQEGLYRLIQKKRATSQAFQTTAVRDFAFTAIQSFVVPGSCPNINLISKDLKTFKPLTVVDTVSPGDRPVKFSFSKKDCNTDDWKTLKVNFINSQTLPITADLDNVQVNGDVVTFTAQFPQQSRLLNGLTIAAVTTVPSGGSFASADAVANATIFGPGLIEIN